MLKFSSSLKTVDRAEFADWKRMRRYYARRAFDAAHSHKDRCLLLRDGDEIVGIAAVDWRYIRGYLFVDYFATKRRGYGVTMMQRMLKMARRKKCGLTLIADHGALGFYRKLKMKENHLFTWTGGG